MRVDLPVPSSAPVGAHPDDISLECGGTLPSEAAGARSIF